MVFGTFDGVHGGHQSFLRQAREQGDYLIAVVAPDRIVEHLKHRPPQYSAEERSDHLRNEDHVDEVIIGDEELGSWEVIQRYRPDVVAVGYDQDELRDNLTSSLESFNWHLEIATMDPHEPERYKSSFVSKE